VGAVFWVKKTLSPGWFLFEGAWVVPFFSCFFFFFFSPTTDFFFVLPSFAPAFFSLNDTAEACVLRKGSLTGWFRKLPPFLVRSASFFPTHSLL